MHPTPWNFRVTVQGPVPRPLLPGHRGDLLQFPVALSSCVHREQLNCPTGGLRLARPLQDVLRQDSSSSQAARPSATAPLPPCPPVLRCRPAGGLHLHLVGPPPPQGGINKNVRQCLHLTDAPPALRTVPQLGMCVCMKTLLKYYFSLLSLFLD